MNSGTHTDLALHVLSMIDAPSTPTHRLLNLELLLKFGPASHRVHNQALASHSQRLNAEVTETKQAVDALNRERKLQQVCIKGHCHKYDVMLGCGQEMDARYSPPLCLRILTPSRP